MEGSNPSVSCQIPADAGPAGTSTTAAATVTAANTRDNVERKRMRSVWERPGDLGTLVFPAGNPGVGAVTAGRKIDE
ncbi:hypothetical protein HerbRD11066_20310 [Herbidospora sp. RD11066]